MRACYFSELKAQAGEKLTIRDELFHHLARVVRIQAHDDLLLLNGKGMKAFGRVESISKKELVVSISKVEELPQSSIIDVLIITPKREALEFMLKMATELGVKKIWLLRGEYSQEKLIEDQRALALLESALEQSNNPWLPEVRKLAGWDDVPTDGYDSIVVLDTAPGRSQGISGRSVLLVVGPEGGFSPNERQRLATWPKSSNLHLKAPILRAPTALVAGWGWVSSKLEGLNAIK